VSIIQQLVSGLLDQFSPASAEAKVLPQDPQTRELHAQMTGPAAPQGTLPALWQDIYRAADVHPTPVTMTTQPNAYPAEPRVRGTYEPERHAVTLSAVRSAVQDPELSENAAHELLHFLMHEYAAHQLGGVAGTDEQQTQQRQLLEAQHAIIGKILGQSTARLGLEWGDLSPLPGMPSKTNTEPMPGFRTGTVAGTSPLTDAFLRATIPGWYPTRPQVGGGLAAPRGRR
jgi:hypothetical protein